MARARSRPAQAISLSGRWASSPRTHRRRKPAGDHLVDKARSARHVQRPAGGGEQPGQPHHPPVPIELMLVGGPAVYPEPAGCWRTRATRFLTPGCPWRVSSTGADRWPVWCHARKWTGLVILAHAEERADTDGVPGPGSPSCGCRPVGRGGRRHRRTRRGVGEQPKGEQAAHHGVAVGNVVGDAGAPAAPAPLVVAAIALRPGST